MKTQAEIMEVFNRKAAWYDALSNAEKLAWIEHWNRQTSKPQRWVMSEGEAYRQMTENNEQEAPKEWVHPLDAALAASGLKSRPAFTAEGRQQYGDPGVQESPLSAYQRLMGWNIEPSDESASKSDD